MHIIVYYLIETKTIYPLIVGTTVDNLQIIHHHK